MLVTISCSLIVHKQLVPYSGSRRHCTFKPLCELLTSNAVMAPNRFLLTIPRPISFCSPRTKWFSEHCSWRQFEFLTNSSEWFGSDRGFAGADRLSVSISVAEKPGVKESLTRSFHVYAFTCTTSFQEASIGAECFRDVHFDNLRRLSTRLAHYMPRGTLIAHTLHITKNN